MKKYIMILSGMIFSVMMMAQGGSNYNYKIEKHYETYDADPYEDGINYTLRSTLKDGNPAFCAFYQVNRSGGMDLIGQAYVNDPKTKDVFVPTGERVCIVGAKADTDINAPERRMPAMTEDAQASEAYPEFILPDPYVDGWTIEQFDIYYIHVKYPVMEHNVTLYADMISGKADYTLYSTAGTIDPETGKTFGGVELYYMINQGTSEDQTNLRQMNFNPEDIEGDIQLGLGQYVYSVYTVDRYKTIMRCDRFYIEVLPAQCRSGLVYTKWDDFMFVDNGVEGGNSTFVAYQWYNEGKKIEGATKQWLRTTQTEGTAPSGRYYVYITDKMGGTIVTCPTSFGDLPRSQASNPHDGAEAPMRKQLRDGQLIIHYEGKTYNAQGNEVK